MEITEITYKIFFYSVFLGSLIFLSSALIELFLKLINKSNKKCIKIIHFFKKVGSLLPVFITLILDLEILVIGICQLDWKNFLNRILPLIFLALVYLIIKIVDKLEKRFLKK